jgi:hypothetical protein
MNYRSMDPGMVQKYVGTSYDVLKKIHDNLDFLIGNVSRQDIIMDQLFYRYVATGNQTAFNGVDSTGRLMAVPASSSIVYINRIRQDADTYTVSGDGTSVTFNSGVAADAIVQIASFAFNADGTMYHSGVMSNTDLIQYGTDIKALYDATVILEATATTKASEASTDREAVAADLLLTDEDATSTAADVVTTNADAAAAAQAVIDADASAAEAQVAKMEWKGGWATSTDYELRDVFYKDGSSYICIVAHTSGTFATDLAADNLELVAQKGLDGDGAGDMIASNNLSDVSPEPARNNLGLTIGTDVQAFATVLENTTASFLTAEKSKLGYIAVSQSVDLDQMETDIAALSNGMVYKGDWDASSGSFAGAGSAQIGWFYYVSVAGTVDGVAFAVGDNIIAKSDDASATTFAGNWSKHDQTDAVQAVVGLTGSISKSSLLTALNVSDGATITNATTVEAAGALMDNEVTNLAQVKAFAAADYATAAQGTLAGTSVQPNSSPTLNGLTATNYTDVDFTLTGTTPALDPANGGIQLWTLTGASTPTDGLTDNEHILLMLDDGTGYGLTLPTGTWLNNAGAAPTLATTGYTTIVLSKMAGTLYFTLVGDGT